MTTFLHLIILNIFLLFLLAIQTNSTQTEKKFDSNKIIFPGDMYFANGDCDETERKLFSAQNFCVKAKNVPHSSELDVAEKKKLDNEFAAFFGEEPQLYPFQNVSERFGDPELEYLCKTIEKTVFPTSSETSTGKTHFIINDNQYKQPVRIEYCEHGGNGCDQDITVSRHYKTKCVQLYATKQLVGLNEEKKVYKDYFRFPSCCKCALYK